jgi:hypothetical protein
VERRWVHPAVSGRQHILVGRLGPGRLESGPPPAGHARQDRADRGERVTCSWPPSGVPRAVQTHQFARQTSPTRCSVTCTERPRSCSPVATVPATDASCRPTATVGVASENCRAPPAPAMRDGCEVSLRATGGSFRSPQRGPREALPSRSLRPCLLRGRACTGPGGCRSGVHPPDRDQATLGLHQQPRQLPGFHHRERRCACGRGARGAGIRRGQRGARPRGDGCLAARRGDEEGKGGVDAPPVVVYGVAGNGSGTKNASTTTSTRPQLL